LSGASLQSRTYEIQEIIGTTGDSDIVARISADPCENLL